MYQRLFLTLVLLCFAAPLRAHPLTDIRFDRTAAVRFAPDALELTYTLEVGSLAMQLDASKRLTREEIAALDRTSLGLARVYAKKVASELTSQFNITVDGQPLPLQIKSINVTMTDHAVCRFSLRAAWPAGKRERTLTIIDKTFPDQPGILNLTLDYKGGSGRAVEILESEEPPAKLRTRPLAMFTPEEEVVARSARAEILLPAAIPQSTITETTKPTTAASPPLQSSVSEESPLPEVNAVTIPAPDLASDLVRRGLPALFDSTLGTGVLLLAAFLFGAAHAFTPGHGKTLVAAYLIGERGTVRHAVLLATATTLTHTGSVIAVAAILWSVYGNEVPGRTQGGLQFIAGMLVIGVGLWLLLRRVTGRADHFHLFVGHHHHDHGHHHHHGHGHHHHHEPDDHAHEHSHDHGPSLETVKTTGGWLRIVLMGLGGGIVPCWDAVLLLVAATALNRVGFAIPLLLAFSAGLGAVLVGLGISVVTAYRYGARRFRDSRWFHVLPMVSAVFLIGVGFWLCKQAAMMTVR